jgi:hypothetical protein
VDGADDIGAAAPGPVRPQLSAAAVAGQVVNDKYRLDQRRQVLKLKAQGHLETHFHAATEIVEGLDDVASKAHLDNVPDHPLLPRLWGTEVRLIFFSRWKNQSLTKRSLSAPFSTKKDQMEVLILS